MSQHINKDIALGYDTINGCPWLIVSAFRRELDKIGAQNISRFNKFTEEIMWEHSVIFLTDTWWTGSVQINKKGYAFSNSEPSDTKLFFRIPEQWDEAIAAVKQFVK